MWTVNDVNGVELQNYFSTYWLLENRYQQELWQAQNMALENRFFYSDLIDRRSNLLLQNLMSCSKRGMENERPFPINLWDIKA